MKNIYIVGVPRTGKSTLAKLIKFNYPQFNLISFEAIRNGFIKSQPNLEMGNRNSVARQEIFPIFLFEFVHWNNVFSNYGNLIEGDFSSIEKIVKNTDENDFIICLGFNKRNIEEIIKGIIKYDKDTDYTKNWSEEKIRKHFYDICEKDKENYDLCSRYNINYYDTYENREEVFSNIISLIKEKVLTK